MKKEINKFYNGDVRELCDDLTSDEKREIVEEIVSRGFIGIFDVYQLFTSRQKQELKDHIITNNTSSCGDDLFYYDNPLNGALVRLLDKSHMLTNKEETTIIEISKKYEHF